ncbi:MAG: VWA domain-containing protein [Ferruginibacter sp.]|nr:VWA domain-containing protein [Cytophagales bacterium]
MDWFSTAWFSARTLGGFEWEKPYFLYFLPVVPLLFFLRWLIHERFQQRLSVAFARADVRSSPVSHLRHLPTLLMTLVIAGILVALARPQRINERVEQYSEGIDILLALDISQSMLIRDFKPDRLEAAKQVAQEFVQGRSQDRIGVVVFAGEAYALCPLTTDYKLLNVYIDEISSKLIQVGGTAIGSALAVATNRMRDSNTKSKVVILISDGDNTAGNLDPFTAAGLAKAFGIKLYTIAVGREGQVALPEELGGGLIENSIDETTLRRIAQIGEGQFFRASDNQALKEIFNRIDRYEKAEIIETRFKDTKDFYQVYLSWAIVFFLLWMLCKNTFIANILED